ncbi:hypothetical protein AM586_11175 [Massilia sp. WG5]|nr:hypothetical protein AM586_11175 [Massilia sp. WG5]
MWSDAMLDSEAIEIVTFRLVRGVSFADFVEANRDVDAWLKLQPGFRSRRIAEERDARIVDVLLWDSGAAARSAMHKLMSELAGSPVHALIDHATVTWTVAEIRHKHAIDH